MTSVHQRHSLSNDDIFGVASQRAHDQLNTFGNVRRRKRNSHNNLFPRMTRGDVSIAKQDTVKNPVNDFHVHNSVREYFPNRFVFHCSAPCELYGFSSCNLRAQQCKLNRNSRGVIHPYISGITYTFKHRRFQKWNAADSRGNAIDGVSTRTGAARDFNHLRSGISTNTNAAIATTPKIISGHIRNSSGFAPRSRNSNPQRSIRHGAASLQMAALRHFGIVLDSRHAGAGYRHQGSHQSFVHLNICRSFSPASEGRAKGVNR